MTEAAHSESAQGYQRYREARTSFASDVMQPFLERAMERPEPRDLRAVRSAMQKVSPLLSTLHTIIEESVQQSRNLGFTHMRHELFAMGIRQGVGPEGAKRYALPSSEEHLALRRQAVRSLKHSMQEAIAHAVASSTLLRDGVTVLDVLNRASAALTGQDDRVRRILRTETQIGYNQARFAMLKEMGHRHGLMQRWTEMIDANGKPLDNKVAPDSFAMHGLLAHPGKPFIIPNDDRIPAARHGKSILYPPLRPNDRAVLTAVLSVSNPRGTQKQR